LNLVIRSAATGDLGAMTAIEADPGAARYLGVLGLDYHKRAMADPDQEQIVADEGGVVIGFVVLAGLTRADRRIELRRIAIDRDHRGAGRGRALFRTAIQRAREQHGAQQVWLDVKPDNAVALALYASEGFVPDGIIPDPTDPGGLLQLLVLTP
jgi:diamine N-acetyltransferase